MELARALVLGLILLAASPAWAATYYVDVDSLGGTCNDSNAGTVATAPWCTAQRATGQANVPGTPPNAVPTAGDTVLFRAGTYFYNVTPASAGSPCLVPTNSGTSGNVLTYARASSADVVIWDCNQYGTPDGEGSPVYGGPRSYVTFDGLSLNAGEKKIVRIQGASAASPAVGVTVKNAVVNPGARASSGPTGNYYCFFIQNTTGTTLYNNQCSNAYDGGDVSIANAGGVVNFNSQSMHVYHNNFINVGLCMDDKEAGRDNIWEYNYCVANAGGRGMQFTALSNFCTDCTVHDNIVRYNVMRGNGLSGAVASIAVNMNFGTSGSGISIYNNSIFGFNTGVRMASLTSGATGISIYNNIFSLTQGGAGENAYRFNDVPPTLVSEYNTFYMNSGALQFGCTTDGAGGVEVGLSSTTGNNWRSSLSVNHLTVAYDNVKPSITTDPAFTGATSTPNAVTDFQLGPTSGALGAGNTSPTGSGSAINMGAYFTGGEQPGHVAVAAATGTSGSPRMLHMR